MHRAGPIRSRLQKLEQAWPAIRQSRLQVDLKGRHDEAVQKLIARLIARARRRCPRRRGDLRRVLAIESGNNRAIKGLEGVEADMRHAQQVSGGRKMTCRREIEQAGALLRTS